MTTTRLKNISSNIISVMAKDIFNRGSIFIVYLLISRYLSVYEFGQMSLALTLFFIFQIIAGVGLKILIMREVVLDKAKSAHYLRNGSWVVAVASLLAIMILSLLTYILGYAPDTTLVILTLSLSLLPASLATIYEAIFQAWEQMQYIAYANIPGNIIRVLGAFLLLQSGYGLVAVTFVIALSWIIVLLLEIGFMRRFIANTSTKFDLQFSKVMVRAATTFLGLQIATSASASLNILLLSKLASETDVGHYSAIVQLILPAILILQGITDSVFPIMCRKFDLTLQGSRKVSEYLFELLFIIALPAAVGLFFLAEEVLVFVYGNEEFLQAIEIVQLLVWSLATIPFVKVLGQILIAGGRESSTLRIVLINGLLSLLLGLILITQFGLIGAAIASLLVSIIDVVLHNVATSNFLKNLALIQLTWKPVVATLGMGLYLVTAQDQNLWLNIIAGAVIYFVVLIFLMIWASGSLEQFKLRYLYLSSSHS